MFLSISFFVNIVIKKRHRHISKPGMNITIKYQKGKPGDTAAVGDG